LFAEPAEQITGPPRSNSRLAPSPTSKKNAISPLLIQPRRLNDTPASPSDTDSGVCHTV